ncbi:LysR family transcriptional regulator [Paraburkholderia sp. J67]|uniref:LysR family transcriptional regulator n=1 Tax=Paraburkholderia sp. J67 TaxID=2805435 RepID=UPI002ABE0D9E|nr:LysR family transcriptional regulator [Paraburkholderia sp. J67]
MPALKSASPSAPQPATSRDAARLAALPVALRRLRLRDLETLEWLGRFRSFARTAEAASISQPALSKWLRELEESLGLKLFERTSRRVEPTLYGEAMLDCIARILNDLREIEPAFEALRHGLAQPLTIGLLPNMDEQFLPGVLAWLREHDTPIQLNTRVDTLDRLLPLAQRRELDLLVCRLEATALASGLHVDELLRDDVVVVAGHRHPLHRRSRVDWPDAAAFPWIAPPLGSPMRVALEAEFARAGHAMPQILMESALHHTNRAVAQRMPCLFVTSATRANRSDATRELRALPLKLTTIAPAIGALSHEPRSAAVATVLEALRHAANEQRLPA